MLVALNALARPSRVLALQPRPLALAVGFLSLQIASHGLLAHFGHDIFRLEVGGIVARDEEQAIAVAVIGRGAR